MDTFTEQHLATWLERVIFEEEQSQVEIDIRRFVAKYPEVLEDMSWPEIRRLAARELSK